MGPLDKKPYMSLLALKVQDKKIFKKKTLFISM